jgi:hypothetical protein
LFMRDTTVKSCKERCLCASEVRQAHLAGYAQTAQSCGLTNNEV